MCVYVLIICIIFLQRLCKSISVFLQIFLKQMEVMANKVIACYDMAVFLAVLPIDAVLSALEYQSYFYVNTLFMDNINNFLYGVWKTSLKG